MRHFDRMIDDGVVWYSRSQTTEWCFNRFWRPVVEWRGSTYVGGRGSNVYVVHPSNPTMPTFCFAQGVPEH